MKFIKYLICCFSLIFLLSASSLADSPPSAMTNPNNAFSIFEPKGSHNKKLPILFVFEDLGCPHCREFQEQELQTFIKKYVYTGKLRIIELPFVLNGLTAQASALVLSLPLQDRPSLVASYFTTQRKWLEPAINSYGKSEKAIAQEVLKRIKNTAKFNGLSEKKINQILAVKGTAKASAKVLELVKLRTLITKKFSINGTPSFVIYVKGKPKKIVGFSSSLMKKLDGYIQEAIK